MKTPLFFDYWADVKEWPVWDAGHLVQLVIILLALAVLAVVFRMAVSSVLSHALVRATRFRFEDQPALKRRADTLAAVLNWGFRVLLGFVGVGLVLSELGLDVTALVASVGVVGVALGLGAQMLVRDIINGLFILLEDQYAVGDQVTVAGVSGEVVEINPRRTVVRDGEGNVHSIPNSAIVVATNRTPGLSRFFVEVRVPFRESDEAAALMATVAAEVAKENPGVMPEPPRIVATRAEGASMAIFRIAGDATPARRWSIEADLRRRLKRRAEGARLDLEFEDGASGARPPEKQGP
ncbi:MAG: mechanosensitive ion channel [Chloroflexi bacterium]|nr:mechanosensitive ion channel [Chloroflexota bacterium]